MSVCFNGFHDYYLLLFFSAARIENREPPNADQNPAGKCYIFGHLPFWKQKLASILQESILYSQDQWLNLGSLEDSKKIPCNTCSKMDNYRYHSRVQCRDHNLWRVTKVVLVCY